MGLYIDILDPKEISGRSSLNCQMFPDVQRESCSAMKLPFRLELKLESIELFIEELAPHPPPPHRFLREVVPLSQSSSNASTVDGRAYLRGMEEEPNLTIARKPGPL